MAMRYHWGWGIGHTYSHGRDAGHHERSATSKLTDGTEEEETPHTPTSIFHDPGCFSEKPDRFDEHTQAADRENTSDVDGNDAVSSDSDASSSDDGLSYDGHEDEEECLELYHTYRTEYDET